MTWIGWIDTGAPTNASFLINDQSSNIVLPLGVDTVHGRVFFQSPLLSLDAPHTLKVSSMYTNISLPLSLQSLVIGNGSIPPSISSGTRSSTQSASAQPSDSSSSTPTTQTMGTNGIHRQTLGPVIAGSVAGTLLILGVIIFALWRLRKHQPSFQTPTVQPFSVIPPTYFARFLHYQSVLRPGAKERRTLPLPIPNTVSMPLPAKFRRLRPTDGVQEHSTAGPTPTEPVSQMTEPVDIPDLDIRSNGTRRLGITADIQEEDSGLRMVDETNPDEQIIWILPPAYSAE